MIDETEARVHAAVLSDAPDFDFSGLQARVKRRRTRRRTIQASIVTALVIAVSGFVVSVRQSDDGSDDASHVAVPTTLPPITWTRSPGIPGAVISKIVSGPLGTVAVGNASQNATIWYSSDNGTTWNVVYSEPPTTFSAPPDPANPRLPQTNETASSDFVNAYATTHGFVVIGSQPTDTPNSAAVWTSPNGRTWQRNKSPAFLPTTKVIPTSVTSTIYGLTEHHGQLVAVGDIFTNNPHQQAGLSPCIWTSQEGTHWTRKTANLGNGFDPYFTGITVHAGTYVASGRTGKYPATAWISHDLKHWTPYTIAPQATAQIVHTPKGYIAYGSTSAGTDNNLSLYKPANLAIRQWTNLAPSPRRLGRNRRPRQRRRAYRLRERRARERPTRSHRSTSRRNSRHPAPLPVRGRTHLDAYRPGTSRLLHPDKHHRQRHHRRQTRPSRISARERHPNAT